MYTENVTPDIKFYFDGIEFEFKGSVIRELFTTYHETGLICRFTTAAMHEDFLACHCQYDITTVSIVHHATNEDGEEYTFVEDFSDCHMEISQTFCSCCESGEFHFEIHLT